MPLEIQGRPVLNNIELASRHTAAAPRRADSAAASLGHAGFHTDYCVVKTSSYDNRFRLASFSDYALYDAGTIFAAF
jgi:hypothetical protein